MKRKAPEVLVPPPSDGCGTPQRAAPKRRRVRSAVAVVQTLLTRFFGYLPRSASCART